MNLIESLDHEAFNSYLRKYGNTICGRHPIGVFLGASYFRVLARGQHYGLSARGLAIDVAAAVPEEFPDFRAFWLERPSADAAGRWTPKAGPGQGVCISITLSPAGPGRR